jgi:type II secretory pathway pseudopilin PulG
MRSMDKLKNQRGFTLVEVSILLTVVVILSATITPVMSGAIDSARLSAARAEMVAISWALQAFLDDIGCVFVPQNQGDGESRSSRGGRARSDSLVIAPTQSAPAQPPTGSGSHSRALSATLGASACSAPSVCTGDAVEILISAGDIPALGPEGDDFWVDPPDGEWVDFLEYYLISNTPGDDAGRRFPTLDDCGDVIADLFSGVRAWQGAYLNVGAGDPWGNRYAISTHLLTQTTGEDVVILSAGPDLEIDSQFYMDGFVPGDDDLALIFSTGPTEVPGR